MIKASNIHKSYGNLTVLNGVNLTINKGEFVSIVGSSGAGKSTLLHILGSLDLPDNGEVEINNTQLSDLDQNGLAQFRNKHIGFVFQFHHLLPEFTAIENICIPAFIRGDEKTRTEQKAKALMQELNISGREGHKPNQLSGGEQQRVAVARALINDPDYILADEPTGNLDSQNSFELHQLFARLNQEKNQTFVIVTHNKELAGLTQRTLVMKDGMLTN